MHEIGSLVLSALFLRGSPYGEALSWAGWHKPMRILERHPGSFEKYIAELRREGMWQEAARLDRPGLCSWAERIVASKRVLTAIDDRYPQRWLKVLGGKAPPAIWVGGDFPQGEFVGIAGSRHPTTASLRLAREFAAHVATTGKGLVSGGAQGVDRTAARAAFRASAPVVELLPHGISLAPAASKRGCVLSCAAPTEPFSTLAAMERNTLLYAFSEKTLAIQPKFKEGGTWHGAASALRRRLCTVLVNEDGTEATQALIALGALPWRGGE